MKTKRLVSQKESIYTENPKKVLLVLSEKSHEMSKKVEQTMSSLQNVESVSLGKRLTLHPFEDSTTLQQLCYKNDCSLFEVYHHSKKRPENVVIGRLFNFNVLEMIEFGHSIIQEDTNARLHSFLGSKPVVVFTGQSSCPLVQRLQNLFLDLFGGQNLKKLSVSGLDRVLLIDIQILEEIESMHSPIQHMELLTFPENALKVTFYHFPIKGSNITSGNGVHIPENSRVALQLDLRRARLASAKAFSECIEKPDIRLTREKGVSRDALGNLKGQVHVGKQKTEKIIHRRFASKVTKRDGDGNFKKVKFGDSEPNTKRKGYRIPDFAADF